MAWIGVDLDGTLATYDGFKGLDEIGEPIEPMAERVRKWVAEGTEVRIMTARVCTIQNEKNIRIAKTAIQEWCLKHIGKILPVTSEKDFQMESLWDDRAIQVVEGTGERVGNQSVRDQQ